MNKLFDNNISLDRNNHIYTLTSKPKVEFTSVTTFIDQFFEKFDAIAIATKLVNSSPKYMDKTVDDILKIWKESANHGTKVHEELENYILKKTPITEKKTVHGLKWLKNFILTGNFKIYPEVIIYSEKLKLCGTIDLLIKNMENNKFLILDWKTSKLINKKSYNKKVGIHAASKNIEDSKFNHYSLQLSLYRFLLEKFYGLEIYSQSILHLKENECKEETTPYMKNEIKNMINSNLISN